MSLRTAFLMLCCASAASLAAQTGTCPSANWTIYTNYTDPATGFGLLSAFIGDGVQIDGNGNSVYTASIFNCAHSNPSYDAILQTSKKRSFHVSLNNSLGNDYQKFPPSSTMTGGMLKISNIQYCQNNGLPNGCTFYTRLGTSLTASDGNAYQVKMENPNSVAVRDYTSDATANCPYMNSLVQVVFTPGSLSRSGKDTYVVTPVLQGTNTGSGWIAPPQAAGCPSAVPPTGTWPAGVAVLVQPATGNSYDYGQYDIPFKFVIENP
jgi:hypothetical protein